MPTEYDRVPYSGRPFAQTHPDRLASLGVLFGLEPAAVNQCRVLELACGDGGNLIPMAFEFPGSEFLGIDLARSGIDLGRHVIESLGLRNIRLEQMDLLDAGPELATFDYIIAHGLYSWVPEPVRNKLLAVVAGHLAPQGIAYVSYNALPGCRIREMFRDMLLFHGRGLAEPDARLAGAGEFLRSFAAVQEARGPDGSYLNSAAQSLIEKDSTVLFHDELGAVYHPVLFHDFVAHAAAYGLQFLAEANYPDMRPRELPEAAVAFAERSAAGDPVARQQYFDFLRNRSFRQTLLCHVGLAVPQDPLAGRVDRLYVSSAATPVSAHPDLRFGAPEEFRGPHGSAITTTHPVVKSAMLAISRRWPEALSFDEVSASAAALAGEAPDRDGLAGMLLAAYGSGLIDFHATPPRSISRVSGFPATTALARWQAAHGKLITTPRHTAVDAAGEVERRLVALLDGAHDLDALARLLWPAVSRQDIAAVLAKLAAFGLLIA